MRYILLTAGLICWLGLGEPCRADTTTDITTALDYYAELWNDGDLETIRSYYHPDFVLITPQGPVTLAQRNESIQSAFQSGEDRGEMRYSGVEVVELTGGHALAYGMLQLSFRDGSSIDSWFSTVYAKTPFGWKAILTHR